jgi:inositol-pentakisphosphate 2-kinase
MHCHLRSTNSLNGYCPLDLYSGNAERIEKAVQILVQPKSTLLKKTLKVSSRGAIEMDTEIMQELLHRILTKDPILTKLKTLQKTLDAFDVEHVYELYHKLEDQQCVDSIAHWESVIARYHERLSFSTDVLAAEKDEFKQRIFEYVLSMTFKDCSLMINVTPTINDSSKTIKLANSQAFSYDIKVIDIDLKDIEKIPFWYELDQSIVRHAKDTNFNKSDCLE